MSRKNYKKFYAKLKFKKWLNIYKNNFHPFRIIFSKIADYSQRRCETKTNMILI